MENLIKFLGNLQTFFNDFIGAVAPGVILAAGMLLVPGVNLPSHAWTAWGEYSWLPATVGLYVAGHILLGVSSLLRSGLSKWIPSWQRPQITAEIDSPLRRLREILNGVLPLSDAQLGADSVRNMAMTFSTTGEELGRRFIFLSQFCFGSGMALLVVGVSWLISATAFSSGMSIDEDSGLLTMLNAALIVVGCSLAWFILTRRGMLFQRHAFTLPFDAALADIAAARLGVVRESMSASGIGKIRVTPSPSDPVTPGAPAPDVLPTV